jgi:ubiquinone/menaquinone biosynthesis C-methylase UbiE
MSGNAKLSFISHVELTYANPVSIQKMESVIELLDLPTGAQVLEIGPGRAELLIRLVERYDARVIGIERARLFMEEAQKQMRTRVPGGDIRLLEMDAKEYTGVRESQDLVICLGATEALGGYSSTLTSLASYLRPSGQLLIGELFWKKPPADDYLQAFGVHRDTYVSLSENISIAVNQGFTPLYASVCSDNEFDDYEWKRCRAVELYARQHPEDDDVPEMLDRIRWWRDLYLAGGRDTLGFGLYLFLK